MKSYRTFVMELSEKTSFVGVAMKGGEAHNVWKTHDGSLEVQNKRTGQKEKHSGSVKDLESKGYSWLDENFDNDKLQKSLDAAADRLNSLGVKKKRPIPNGVGKDEYEDTSSDEEPNPLKAKWNRLRNAQKKIKLSTNT